MIYMCRTYNKEKIESHKRTKSKQIIRILYSLTMALIRHRLIWYWFVVNWDLESSWLGSAWLLGSGGKVGWTPDTSAGAAGGGKVCFLAWRLVALTPCHGTAEMLSSDDSDELCGWTQNRCQLQCYVIIENENTWFILIHLDSTTSGGLCSPLQRLP